MKAELHYGPITISEAAKIVHGDLRLFGCDGNCNITNVAIDSRDCTENTLFVAIRGERTDGHEYIQSAVKSGAVCIFAQYIPKALEAEGEYAIIIVDDPIVAVGELAKAYRQRQSAKIVAVTGSVGKTTTKEFVCSVLSQRFKTYKSSGNHNNELGLPLTLLDMPRDIEYAVLEMGMSALGEIEYLSKIAEPNIALITNVGTSHLEHLKTRENICRAKMEIVSGMHSDGKLILNGDDPMLVTKSSEKHFFAFVSLKNDDCRYRVENVLSDENGTSFDVADGENKIKGLSVHVIGMHNLYAALFAYAVGSITGMTEREIAAGLADFKNVGSRQNVYSLNKITVIDDCYNASPESMRAALDVLDTLSKKSGARRIALLGDMKELGEHSLKYHFELGKYAYGKADVLICFGVLASAIADGAMECGMNKESVLVFTDTASHEQCGQKLLEILRENDVLLVKASRAMEAEKIIGYIKSHI